MYTIEKLRQQNPQCDPKYIQEPQVRQINELIDLVEMSRSTEVPQPGDLLEYIDSMGTWYPMARIEYIKNDIATLCLYGGTFIFKDPLSFSTSGGPWVKLPVKSFRYIGKRKKNFQTPPIPAPYMGGLYFEVNVSMWGYQEPNRLYGDYTTRDWVRNIFSHCVSKEEIRLYGGEYIDYSNHCYFASQEDFNAWKSTYKAVEFPGPADDSIVAFSYRETHHVLSKEEYLRLDLPIDTRRDCRQLMIVKFFCDDQSHRIHTYSYAGEISPKVWSGITHKDLLISECSSVREFERARSGEDWYYKLCLTSKNERKNGKSKKVRKMDLKRH